MESFREARNWLETLKSEAQFFRKVQKPSLAVVEKILDYLGRPDQFFDWRVVVGGTAGKGTVCAYVEQTLLDQGKNVAVLSSPEIQVLNERIRINGKLIDDCFLEKQLLIIKKSVEALALEITFYEAVVLSGILAAKESDCEILITEIGLGGRLDAVNAVKGKRIAALTFVGEDHLEFFDYSLQKLAREKAGIFTKDSILNLTYDKKNCSYFEEISNSEIILIKGILNKLNKKIARKIVEKILQKKVDVMTHRNLPCRWEKIKIDDRKWAILDGAHSIPRFEFIEPKLKKIQGKKVGVFAMTKNHDPKGFEIIAHYFDEIIWTEVPEKREFWKTDDLQKKLKRGLMEKNPQKAFKKALQMSDKVFVLGSFFLAGEIRENFYLSADILRTGSEFLD